MTEGRQPAFPGIFISSIEVETPPFDEPGVIQEFVGRGVTKEFEILQRASKVSEESIQEWINDTEELIGPLRDDFKLRYNLIIKALNVPDILTIVNERSVSARARLFVRTKNPFEPEILNVSTPEINESLSSEEIGDVYNVSVTVTK